MKTAFTLIEVVFVIVVVGILAAVALPKLAGTADEAQKSHFISFMGTLNRTVGAVLWANNLDKKGSIKNVSAAEFLETFMQVPEGVSNIDLSLCADSNASIGRKVADIAVPYLNQAEEIFCVDGNPTIPPKFAYSADMNRTLQRN